MSDEQVNAATPTDDDTKVEESVTEETPAPEAPEKTEDGGEGESTETPDAPAEAEEAPEAATTEQAEPEPKLSRKERREERKNYLESIRRESQTVPKPEEDYNPLDLDNPEQYSKEDGFVDPSKLREDREKYAKQVAAREREEAEQDHFLRELQLEAKGLQKDPEFKFMDEESEDFDADLVSDINQRYLAMVGHYVDPQNGKHRFRNTDISFEKFAREEMARLKRYAGMQTEQSTKNIVAAKSKQAVRPGGTQKGPSIATPDDIAKMSPAEFKKHEEEILKFASTLPKK